MVDDELAALRAKMRQNAGPSEGLPPRIDKEKIHLLAPAHAVNAAEVADLLDRDAASVQQRDETECVASLPLRLFPPVLSVLLCACSLASRPPLTCSYTNHGTVLLPERLQLTVAQVRKDEELSLLASEPPQLVEAPSGIQVDMRPPGKKAIKDTAYDSRVVLPHSVAVAEHATTWVSHPAQ